MSQLIRTSQDFTTGIVNVPLNTPVTPFFISHSDSELRTIETEFKAKNIPYELIYRRFKTIVMGQAQIARATFNDMKKAYPLLSKKSDYRYFFFELDDLDEDNLNFVLGVYADYKLPVFYHRTMRGWHFISIKPISEDIWHEALSKVKELNPSCPHVTLRIRPNKWENEAKIWKESKIFMSAHHSDTVKLKQIIDNQYVNQLRAKYFIVNYRMTGELGDL